MRYRRQRTGACASFPASAPSARLARASWSARASCPPTSPVFCGVLLASNKFWVWDLCFWRRAFTHFCNFFGFVLHVHIHEGRLLIFGAIRTLFCLSTVGIPGVFFRLLRPRCLLIVGLHLCSQHRLARVSYSGRWFSKKERTHISMYMSSVYRNEGKHITFMLMK